MRTGRHGVDDAEGCLQAGRVRHDHRQRDGSDRRQRSESGQTLRQPPQPTRRGTPPAARSQMAALSRPFAGTMQRQNKVAWGLPPLRSHLSATHEGHLMAAWGLPTATEERCSRDAMCKYDDTEGTF